MVQRLAIRTVFAALFISVTLSAGCGGGNSGVTLNVGSPNPSARTVTGTVMMPNGQLAQLEDSWMERVAGLAVSRVDALTGSNVRHVGPNVTVTLQLLTGSGQLQTYSSALTNDQGQYQVELPAGTDENTCRYFVSVGDVISETLTRAFVFSTSSPVDIDFASEAVVRMILNQVPAGHDLCGFTVGTIEATVDAVHTLPGFINAPDARDLNLMAVQTATVAPEVQQTLGIAATATPTLPAATNTPITPAATPTTPAATPTTPGIETPPPTATATSPVVNTPTPTITGTPTAQPAQLSIASAIGRRGETVNIGVNLSNGGGRFAAVFNAIVYDSTDADVVLDDKGNPSCTAGTGLTLSIDLQTGGTTKTLSVRASAVVQPPSVADGLVYSCQFLIQPNAKSDIIALNIAAPTGILPDQTSVPVNGSAGSITVLTSTPVTLTPTNTPATPTATPPTQTPAPSPPAIAIGSGSGSPGGQVSIPISLSKNGVNIVTIAPLVFTFDPTVLTFGNCSSDVSGKQVSAVSPSTGNVNLVMSGGLATVPDGTIAHCTFTIASGAASGQTLLTFVNAGMADDHENDYTATGTSGAVTVNTPQGPQIAIGSATGAAGTQVTVPIGLTKNGRQIVTIAPLVFTFDPNVLTFSSCASDVTQEQLDAVSPSAGHASFVMYSTSLAVIPDGQIAHCTFTINAGAAAGPSALTFMAAGLADATLTDFSGSGSSGVVTVTTPTGPQISIGTTSGGAGTQVSVPIGLTKNGRQIVTIAPLVFTFDPNVLSFNNCSADVAQEQVDAVSPSAGQVSFVMHSSTLVVIPDGQIAHCTFMINAGAASGPSTLTYVAAGVADINQTDFTASGSSGTVTVTTANAPQISIGTASGAPGAQVNVPIGFSKNGPQIVTIAPLVFSFDSNVLTFTGCASDLGAVQVDAVSPSTGRVSLVMHSATLVVISDGQIAHCTFTIKAGAAAGPSALTFVAAGVADANQTDFTAAGSSGTITVSSVSGPTITIGTSGGAPGTQVNVPVSLNKNGAQIVTIAPLVFSFDSNVLTFNSCASDAPQEQIDAVSPATGHVSFVMHSATLAVIPDGQIAHCTFTINGGAAAGPSNLIFVAAGLADAAQNDLAASGSSGTITVSAASGPVVTIGNASGAPSAQVSIPISLNKNGAQVVTIAPFVFTFDAGVLTFDGCASDVAQEQIDAVSPAAGHVSFVMHSAALAVIPDGQIAHCTFTINGGAAAGQSPLTFVAAGMADAAQNDTSASGIAGSITVQ